MNTNTEHDVCVTSTCARPDNDREHAAWQRLLDDACKPYRAAGLFAHRFAHGKLRRDPVFRHLLQQGLIAPHSRVLDIGCGQGLLASLLLAAGDTPATAWPAGWAAAPKHASFTGIELMPRDIARARAALGHAEGRMNFICADMRAAALPSCDAVVILDVLHYIPIADQDALLQRVRDALSPNGRLLLRIGDAQSRRRFRISQWVDRLVTWTRGHRIPPTFGRTLPAWVQQLQSIGFDVEPRPMSQGTPFANVLLVATARQAVTAQTRSTASANA
jgi:SAM-dependent methyltransferase